MIRVNLLRQMGASTTGPSAGSTAAPNIEKAGAIRFVTILLFPLLLVILERVLVSDKAEVLKKMNAELSKIHSEMSKLDNSDKVRKYSERRTALEGQLQSIQEIARTRLREVKTLDAIQSLMPPQTWLSSLTIDRGIVVMKGAAVSFAAQSELLQALENSAFFSQIEDKSSTSSAGSSTGETRPFVFEFKIGRQE